MNWEYLENLFKQLLDKNNNLSSQKIKDNKNVINELNNYDLLINFPSIKEKYYAFKYKLEKRPLCLCGKETNFLIGKNKYALYCSRGCKKSLDYKLINRITTVKEKYGVDNISQLDEIKDKKIKTNLFKYGVENPSQNEEIKEKIKQTNLGKYGVNHIFQNKEIRNNIQVNINNEYKNKLLSKFESGINLYNVFPHNWEIEDYTGCLLYYEFIHNDCGLIFKRSFQNNNGIVKCPKCHRLYGRSRIEEKLQNYLFNVIGKNNILCNGRNLIKPYELDIVIDNKLAVEVNGSYWHKEEFEKLTLLEKSNLCPIPILHFWDYELESKFDICTSIILSKVGKFENIVFARRCEFKKVNSKDAREFFDRYHLQGRSNTSLNYGLYYQDELIQCISIGKARFSKKYDYEIHRMASKLNTQIVGGVSKLFSRIKKDLLGMSLITYADKRISNGDIYRNLGFKELTDSSPNYTWRNGDRIYPRYQTQKHKLSKLLKNFNPELSESENMKNNHFHKFNDCGNKVFEIQL